MKLVDEIKQDEGLRLKPYLCTADKLTIGYGRNLEDKGITEAEADYLLANDILSVTHQLRKRVPFFDRLEPFAQEVLINMAFNLGISGLLTFKKMFTALEIGHYERAATEMLDSRYARQVGGRAVRLSKKLKGE